MILWGRCLNKSGVINEDTNSGTLERNKTNIKQNKYLVDGQKNQCENCSSQQLSKEPCINTDSKSATYYKLKIELLIQKKKVNLYDTNLTRWRWPEIGLLTTIC